MWVGQSYLSWVQAVEQAREAKPGGLSEASPPNNLTDLVTYGVLLAIIINLYVNWSFQVHCTLYSAFDYPYFIFFLYEHFWFSLFSIFCNWHIQWNENLALELSYDLGLGCSPLFCNSTDYDSSYPWIRLRFVHLMGVHPVQTYCWITNVSISLPSPTSDNAMNMSSGYLILPKKKYKN